VSSDARRTSQIGLAQWHSDSEQVPIGLEPCKKKKKKYAYLKQEQIFIRSNFLQNCTAQGVRQAVYIYICAAGKKIITAFLEKGCSSQCSQNCTAQGVRQAVYI